MGDGVGVAWFHASPQSDLHETGIDPNAPPLVSCRTQGWVYFGSRGYLFEQYFNYAPKRRKYYIYRVNTEGLPIDTTPLAGEQIRTAKFVDADRVELVEVFKPSG